MSLVGYCFSLEEILHGREALGYGAAVECMMDLDIRLLACCLINGEKFTASLPSNVRQLERNH